jgi:hypothetical protein
MTHRPGVPPGSTPPYPSHPTPHAQTTPPEQVAMGRQKDDEGSSPGRASLIGAAVGIGSAAIVAALIYARRKRA